MVDAQQKIIRAIRIVKPYHAQALVDGWLCIKYLDGREESISTFADVSRGDMILYGNATANHNGMSESPDPSVDCFWKCKHYKNLGDEEKTSIRNQALDDILNNPKVIVTKESPCVVTDENPYGRCTFDNEHCEECHEKHSTAMRIVIPNTIFKSLREHQPGRR